MSHTVRKLILAVGLMAPFAHIVSAQQLDVPIIEQADEDFDTCALGEVYGLKADGDGFLAVRSAPDSSFRKLDEVYNGNRVWIFQQVGKWYGIVYGVDSVDCSPISSDRAVRAPGKKGWVHSNWVRVIAG
ncbi:MAG: SH3 domain-containing protein [Pseudomonadota bacterium]